MILSSGFPSSSSPFFQMHFLFHLDFVCLASRVAKLRSKGSNGKENGGEPFVTDNRNYIVDLYFKRDIGSLKAASNAILRLAGVVEHDMFLDMANTVIVAGELGITIKNKHK
ncbi:probable ribose-5-phosphate isomerase 1 [Hevea brasiliensis]|uniref:probable ribose-5-phosphate isomerase 1 n=1 Tax=Hevea brasiliensis TaxID=3981 RepID=UPI0025EAFB10|nr:probable ribose-5-phosphate isomerase 1 [Hevea brasiliensis]